MKKMILLLGILVSLTAAHVVFAQTSGVITYEIKVNMHRRLPPERAEMKAMIPEFRTTKEQLFFNGNESLFKPLIEDEDEEVSGGGMRIVMRQPNTEIYLDQTSGKMISKQEFMGKNYLIEDSVKLSPWKFGTEIKTIQGYECKQAYYTDEVKMMVNGTESIEKREITAWYTDAIRHFLGPERFNTLPGAVLAVDINNGERVLVARSIELRDLKKNELKVPSSGTKTTQEEYRKMVDEQMKQMGGGRGIMIRN
ncbi:MAG: GLPGLI family protein [Cyclobacteriaceae bacterium]|nr:GLPGLI family protein [Cyclobacteriaceae bacterium]